MENIETIEVEGIACFVSSGRQLFSADKLVGNTPMYCTDLSDKTPLVSSPITTGTGLMSLLTAIPAAKL